jgi:acyl-CoA thioester hydrolase
MIRFPEKTPVISYTHTLRSRYSETDQMGYVYYGRYLEYFEAARTEMIRNLGMPYSRMEKEGVMLPVVYSQIAYRSPVFYDEEINVEVMVFEKPLVKLETYYNLTTYRQSDPHVLGQVNLCFADTETGKPRRAPDFFLSLIDEPGS